MQAHPERRNQLVEIERRSWQLWAITLSITGGLSFGITLLLYPVLGGFAEHFYFERRYLPQLVYGLLVLVVLSGIYSVLKQRELNAMRNFIIASYASAAANEGKYSTDALTGVLDRSALVELLETASARADKLRAPFCLVIFDLWDFKTLNAREGNLAGDLVLKELALLLMRTIRKADWVMRYGPDEFLCLLEGSPRVGGEAFVQRAEKGCAHVERLRGVKINTGLSEYRPGADAELVVGDAEKDLKKRSQLPAPAATGSPA
ncbi:MAG: diguanylate cyclase [Terriglobia bacterium]|jgi:diguanylate cyclase (GGDEF)-like protein